MRQQLELTDEQVKRLETLQQAAPPEPKASEMLRAQADLMDATKGDISLEKARAAFDRMARLRTDEQVAHLKERQDARNVLTVAQKTKFDAFSANVRGAQRGQRGMQRDMRGMQREFQRGPGAAQFRTGPGGPGMGMGPGMGPQGMGRGGMGPGMDPQGMPPGAPMRRRGGPPVVVPPPTDSIR